jgi:parvulin-like peptidyl-prolyl isomerase
MSDNIGSSPFLFVDGEPISLSQCLQYWRESGLFPQILADVLRQHVLKQELANRQDITIDSLAVDQSITDFRVQSQLLDNADFRQWLASNKMGYEEFQQQVEFRLRVEAVKDEIYNKDADEYFQQRKHLWDHFTLSRIILKDLSVAESLKETLVVEPDRFSDFAEKHSIVEDRAIGGFMGSVLRKQMPDILQVEIGNANIDDVIGPLSIDNFYCLFKLQDFTPSSLEESAVQQIIRHELFELWINSKLQSLNITLGAS